MNITVSLHILLVSSLLLSSIIEYLIINQDKANYIINELSKFPIVDIDLVEKDSICKKDFSKLVNNYRRTAICVKYAQYNFFEMSHFQNTYSCKGRISKMNKNYYINHAHDCSINYFEVLDRDSIKDIIQEKNVKYLNFKDSSLILAYGYLDNEEERQVLVNLVISKEKQCKYPFDINCNNEYNENLIYLDTDPIKRNHIYYSYYNIGVDINCLQFNADYKSCILSINTPNYSKDIVHNTLLIIIILLIRLLMTEKIRALFNNKIVILFLFIWNLIITLLHFIYSIRNKLNYLEMGCFDDLTKSIIKETQPIYILYFHYLLVIISIVNVIGNIVSSYIVKIKVFKLKGKQEVKYTSYIGD